MKHRTKLGPYQETYNHNNAVDKELSRISANNWALLEVTQTFRWAYNRDKDEMWAVVVYDDGRVK